MQRPAAGDRIGNYILDERIGSGSFGEVWKGHHHVFGEVVAIKIPTDAQYVRNLRQEGVAVHGLRHPNIVRAIDLDPYAEQPYLVMEYVDGPSLRQILDQHPAGLPLQAVVQVMRGLLSALEAAHAAGLIHRDIKPPNILIAGGKDIRAGDITAEAVRVTDFGLGQAGGLTTASIMQSGSLLTQEGRSISGTIAYMSPEQREGKPVDARSDLYTCGIVFFEMITGGLPAGTDLPTQVRPDVPSWTDDFFSCLYTRYERRIGSAGEALRLLERHTAAPPRAAGPATERRVATPQGWRCGACGGQVAEDDHFCIHCGVQLVERVPRCPVCRAFVLREDLYCVFCGAELRVATC